MQCTFHSIPEFVSDHYPRCSAAKRLAAATVLLAAFLPHVAAWAQGTTNRKVLSAVVNPGSDACSFDIEIHWMFELTGVNSGLDLSTDVNVMVTRGTQVVSEECIIWDIKDSCSHGGACTAPDSCGTATIDTVPTTLYCNPADGDCESPVLVGTLIDLPLELRDKIIVFLQPGTGSISESDTSDDTLQTFFDATLDRSIDEITLIPVGGGLFDVNVDLGLRVYETMPGASDPSALVTLLVNGTPITSISVGIPWPLDDCGGDQCTNCNTPYGMCITDEHGCFCDGCFPICFPNEPLVPSDVVGVSVGPATGAAPELVTCNDTLETTNTTTGINDQPIPSFALIGHLPNPNSGAMDIDFYLGDQSDVTFQVFDVTGRLVATRQRSFGGGQNRLTFDGRTTSGNQLAGGIYFFRVTTVFGSATRKFAVVR